MDKNSMKMDRYIGLDLIKFASAIIVLFHHYYLNTENPTVAIFAGGWIVVELFFMISGYVSVGGADSLRYREYIGRNISRLLPMVWATGLTYVFLGSIYFHSFAEWYRGCNINYWSIIASLSLFFAGGPIENILGINNPTWYLCVLLICFSVYWCIEKLHRKKYISTSFGFVIMIFLGMAIKSFAIQLPFLNGISARGYIPFFLGCLLRKIRELLDERVIIVYSSFAIGLWWIPRILGMGYLYDYSDYSICFILYPALILLGSLSKMLVDIRLKPLFRWSYYIYMWQGCFLIIQGYLYKSGVIKYNNLIMFIFVVFTVMLSGILGLSVDFVAGKVSPRIEKFIVKLFSD